MWTVRLKSKNEREQSVILPAKSRDVCVRVFRRVGARVCVCANSPRNVHPHASLVFSLLHTDRAVEMGRPRFTGRVRGFTSSGPLGTISCLDLGLQGKQPSLTVWQWGGAIQTLWEDGDWWKRRNVGKRGREGRRPPLDKATAALVFWCLYINTFKIMRSSSDRNSDFITLFSWNNFSHKLPWWLMAHKQTVTNLIVSSV